jgi:hypothetical protein
MPISAKSQQDSTAQYLMSSFGANVSSYYSLGVRLYFDYSRDLSKFWQWGVSYETTRHATTSAAGVPEDATLLELNHHMLSGNVFVKLNSGKPVHWRFGAGAGLIHAFWETSNRFGIAMNISAGMHIRLSQKVWLTTSVLPVLIPSNRITYALIDMPGRNHLLSGSFLNLGFQVKL